MTKTGLWCLVGALSVGCIGQGCYIYAQKNAEKGARETGKERPRTPLEDWRAEAEKNLLKGGPFPFSRFDELFDDDFFSRRFDPFAEIEQFQSRFSPLLKEEQRSLFGRSWGEWFENRMGLGDLDPVVEDRGDKIVVSLKIPGAEDASLNVRINRDRIRISYDAKAVEEKKDESGKVVGRSESVRHFEKILPVPEGADPDTGRLERSKGAVEIIFDKRPAAAKIQRI